MRQLSVISDVIGGLASSSKTARNNINIIEGGLAQGRSLQVNRVILDLDKVSA